VRLKCRVSGGKRDSMAMVRVFVWQNQVQLFSSGLEPYPEGNQEFGPITNPTTLDTWMSSTPDCGQSDSCMR